jgi:hypothetical protein
MNTYQQPIKNKAREQLIKHAVESLTKRRRSSYLVTKPSLWKITDHFNNLLFQSLRADSPNANNFKLYYPADFDQRRENWLGFYDSCCKSKKASELKVLYLSGPEPLNDIQVLQSNGIRLENIWAIEADKKAYTQAVNSLQEAGLSIKIHRGTLAEFFELTNHEFDIIYYDACTPLISPSNSPLEILKQIFVNRRLTELSALITNFAEPHENYNWGDMMAAYFPTRDEQESPKEDADCPMEYYERSASLKEYGDFIRSHLHSYYDKFVTHFISVFAGEITPIWQSLSLSSNQSNYLLNEQVLPKKLDEIRDYPISVANMQEILTSTPHFMFDPQGYPLLNWTRHIREHFEKDHILYKLLDQKRKALTLENAMYTGSLLKSFEESRSGFNTFILDICSDNLKKILQNFDFFDRDKALTCDMPMKNLIVELLFGLYGFPYIANAGRTLSLKYKAKETWMFSNVFIFDQCRYLYDYIPTLDLLETFFLPWPHQIIVRGCIDCIHRNHISLNAEVFKYGFIEGVGEHGFRIPALPGRINLNEEEMLK